VRRIISTSVIGFTVVVCCVLWITRRVHRKLDDSRSNGIAPTTKPESSSTAGPPSSPPSASKGEHVAHNKKFWPIAYLLIGISLCFVVTWIYNLSTNLIFLPSSPEGFERALTIPFVADPNDSPGVSTLPAGYHLISTTFKAYGLLMLNITQIKNETPNSATLSGTISFTVPSNLQAQICDSTKMPLVDVRECSAKYSVATQQFVNTLSPEDKIVRKSIYQLKPQYDSENLTLSVDTISNHPQTSFSNTSAFSTSLPLKQIFPSLPPDFFSGGHREEDVPDQVQVTIPMSVTIPLTSQGQAYPDDWYLGRVYVFLELPAHLGIPVSLSEGNSKDQTTARLTYLPMDIRITANTSMSNYALKILPSIAATTEEGSQVALSTKLFLLATRSRLFWWFVYSTIFLVPLAFILVFLHVLFLSKKGEEESLHTTLLNILTMVVTVAAIRQLLVPADLQGGLTRLDLWLGLWGMILLGLFFLKYALQLVRKE
jgi:hypothetical protein